MSSFQKEYNDAYRYMRIMDQITDIFNAIEVMYIESLDPTDMEESVEVLKTYRQNRLIEDMYPMIDDTIKAFELYKKNYLFIKFDMVLYSIPAVNIIPTTALLQ